MNIKHSLFIAPIITLSLFLMLTTHNPMVHTPGPNRLLIVRSMGVGNDSGRESVNDPQVVQQLYYHILSLSPPPQHRICPLYIIATYQLTFYHDRSTLATMSVLQGGCPTVTLSSNDRRATDDLFWSLFEQANYTGVKT